MISISDLQQGYIWLPFIGFLIGMLATTIGSGGGFFFPMILIIFFKIPAQIAVATSLAAGVPLALVGTVGHYYKGNIILRTGMLFGMAGIAGSFAGAAITRIISSDHLKIIFGIYAIALAVLIMMNTRMQKRTPSGPYEPGANTKGKGLAYGFAGGIISGTFGTSGAAPVLAGLFAMRLPVKLVVGTSLMVVFINTIAAFAGHFLIGDVNIVLVLLLTSGSIAGAIAGPLLLSRLHPENYEKSIRYIFSFITLILGTIIIFNSLQ
jgi:uncharacterized protein